MSLFRLRFDHAYPRIQHLPNSHFSHHSFVDSKFLQALTNGSAERRALVDLPSVYYYFLVVITEPDWVLALARRAKQGSCPGTQD